MARSYYLRLYVIRKKICVDRYRSSKAARLDYFKCWEHVFLSIEQPYHVDITFALQTYATARLRNATRKTPN